MEKEKKYFGKWWLWILLLMVMTGIVLGVLNSVGMLGQTIVERKVFENSYQKHEADKTASTVYAAQLAQLRSRLNNPNLTNADISEIKAQIDAITILKLTKED